MKQYRKAKYALNSPFNSALTYLFNIFVTERKLLFFKFVIIKKMHAMKNTLSLIVAVLFLGQLAAQTAPATNAAPMKTSGPHLEWESTVIDYGEIKKGGDPLRKAVFTNTGTEPLIIKSARGSCGCTVPTWPKEPIMPGEKGVIEIRYDTQRVGPINKSVSVTTNESETETRVTIKGNISADEEQTLPKNDGNILTPKG